MSTSLKGDSHPFVTSKPVPLSGLVAKVGRFAHLLAFSFLRHRSRSGPV